MYQLKEPGNSIIIRKTKVMSPNNGASVFGGSVLKCGGHNNAVSAFSFKGTNSNHLTLESRAPTA